MFSPACTTIAYLHINNEAISGNNNPAQDPGPATMEECIAYCEADAACRSVDYEFGDPRKLCAYPPVDQWTATKTGYQQNYNYAEKCHGSLFEFKTMLLIIKVCLQCVTFQNSELINQIDREVCYFKHISVKK